MRRHIEGRESYRVIARWIRMFSGRRVSPSLLQRMVEDLAGRCKSPWEMSAELRPRWSGILALDEKMCSVRGHQQWFYLAVDRTGDIVDCRPISELTATEAMRFLRHLGGLKLRVRAVVTDMDPALCKAVEIVYAGKPHQYCIKHALGAIEKLIGYREYRSARIQNRSRLREAFERLPSRRGVWVERSRTEFLNRWHQTRPLTSHARTVESLREVARRVLNAPSESHAREHFDRLRRMTGVPLKDRRAVVAFLKRHWEHIIVHHRVPGLPRTTNFVENVNKQLERRFKTIEAFQSSSSAIHYTNLLVAYLRQKPYTDCRKSRRSCNGKSRLEMAAVKTNQDWLKGCLKPPPNSNR